jgi:hypothetical protein
VGAALGVAATIVAVGRIASAVAEGTVLVGSTVAAIVEVDSTTGICVPVQEERRTRLKRVEMIFFITMICHCEEGDSPTWQSPVRREFLSRTVSLVK